MIDLTILKGLTDKRKIEILTNQLKLADITIGALENSINDLRGVIKVMEASNKVLADKLEGKKA